MPEQTIKCPKCGCEIQLTEAFTHQIRDDLRLQFDAEIKQRDLDSERRAMERQWSKRQKQIEQVINNTAGMYGDLQGIIGNALPAVKTLELLGGADSGPV